MSEEVEKELSQEQPPVKSERDDQDAVPDATPEAVSTPNKSVSFDNKPLTFDEAQQEIDSIKTRAGVTRKNLRDTYEPAVTSYRSSSSVGEDMPKSKNMLSHLNTEQAMLNYKVQAARSLVRKQEDLLRNLARMRENMERSETELGKASSYYTPRSRVYPRTYAETKSVSVPRRTTRESSPLNIDFPTETVSESKADVLNLNTATNSSSFTSSTSPLVHQRYTPVIHHDVETDEDFEREMAALRKRVSDISRKAMEATSSTKRDYGYYDSSYLKDYESDLIPEVKYSLASVPVSVDPNYTSLYSTSNYLSEPIIYTSLPSSQYSQYVLSALDGYPPAVYTPAPQKDICDGYDYLYGDDPFVY